MNFDRSAVSLRLNNSYVDKIYDVEPQQIKHVTSAPGHFWPRRHNLNKLGRGSQDDATNIMSRL